MPHLEFTVLAAGLLSVGMALLGNRAPAERVYAGLYVFLGCAAAMVVGSWGMYLIHG